MTYKMKLNTKLLYRYIIEIDMLERITSRKALHQCIIDTGSANTFVPYGFAKQWFKPTKREKEVSVAGCTYLATVFQAKSIFNLGGLKIRNLQVLSSEKFTGTLKNYILIGANILNNLKFTLDKEEGIFEFEEKIASYRKDCIQPYRYYFGENGEVLVEDIEEEMFFS